MCTSASSRFTGTVDVLCDVDVSEYVDFLHKIPSSEWRKLTDMTYYAWGEKFRPLAESLKEKFYPGCKLAGIGLWTVEPGQVHPAHTDLQPDEWLVRIHVPIETNDRVKFEMDDGEHHLKVGTAYRFNTLARHAVANRGSVPRVHFIFDIVRQ